MSYSKDMQVLSKACKGILYLKAAEKLAQKENPQFSALEPAIDSLEEWANLWLSESDEKDLKDGLALLKEHGVKII